MSALSDILDTTGLFYYMTMKDYERNERKKQKTQIRRVYPSEKIRLIHSEEKDFLSLFDFKRLKKEVPSSDLRIESYEDLFAFLTRLPIEQCMNPITSLNSYFPCHFIRGNYAWVSKNANGHSRYFSKRKGFGVVSFDLLDLIEIYYGISTMEAIEKVIELFSIRFMEDAWKREQKEKYLRNYQFLSSLRQDEMEVQYPILSAYLKDHLPLMETLNAIGTLHIHKREYTHKDHNVFFSSARYLAQFLESYTYSTVSKLLNLFAVLGLIEKVPTNQLHPLFLKESTRIAEYRNLGNMIGYYLVHPFEQVAEEAERRAKLLDQFGIHYSNCSQPLIEKCFGSEFASTIYVQTIQKHKKQREKHHSSVHFSLEKNFLHVLQKNGFVTKQMVIDILIENFTEKQRKSHLNQIWTYLLAKYNCKYEKPTNDTKKKFGLTTSEYLAFYKEPV